MSWYVAAAERRYVMPIDEPPQTSQQKLDYRTPSPKARRVVVIPRGLYDFHRVLVRGFRIFSIIYGIVVMCVGWLFKAIGFVFIVKPKGQRHKQTTG